MKHFHVVYCKYAKAALVFVILSFFLEATSYSQTDSFMAGKEPLTANVKDSSKDVLLSDTLPVQKKRFWRASGELMLAQVIPWSYNYFVRDAEFAKISFESIGHNLQFKNWKWDDNTFANNQFAHPYHGNLYYSAFRSNGYNFWQSAPAAFVGSFMWEVAGESHPAAPNDFINTSLGGIALGEMTYRLSNLIVDNHQRGFKRQANEVLALIVNPMNGLNRIIDGKWGRYMANPADRKPGMLLGELDLGGRRINEGKHGNFIETGKNEFYARVRLFYGDPFKEVSKPFSNFYFMMELGNDDSAIINSVRVNGFLHGWKLPDSKNGIHLMSITANYDYYKNASFFYGGQSVNFNLLSDFKTGKKSRIRTQAGAGAIILAAIPDDYLYYGEGRNYDYGAGFGMNADATLLVSDKFLFSTHYRGAHSYTIDGNKSSFFLNTLTAETRYFFTKSFSLGAEGGVFNLHGNYADYEDTDRRYPFLRLSAGYRFGGK